MRRSAVTLLFSLAFCQFCHAAPPKELYGKSVVISWTEMREQRAEGAQAWGTIQGIETLNIYVSETGRVFNNMKATTRNGSADGVGQISGEGGRRAITFDGRSMLMLAPHGSSGAIRVHAAFDPSYGSCTADVVKAKESSDAIIKSYSRIINHPIEIKSIKVSGPNCSIRSGNVFGN
jgi:hypothetical protein